MKMQQMHPAQVSILKALRYEPELRYTELRRPTQLESDVFKFHIQTLLKQKVILKTVDGRYSLTDAGIEFANTIDTARRKVQKQPKVSIMMVVSRPGAAGMEYLCQRRNRRPYRGYTGFISGPLLWGVSFENAAMNELYKQTGLHASFTYAGIQRARDYAASTESLLEDKVFIIMSALEYSGVIGSDWPGGENEWLTIDEIESRPLHFEDTRAIASICKEKTRYIDRALSIPSELY